MISYTKNISPVAYTSCLDYKGLYNIIIYPDPVQTAYDIRQAKAWLGVKYGQNCKIERARESDWDDLYRTEIINNILVKGIDKKEIYLDEKLIRKSRIDGLTAREYILNYVWPNVEIMRHNRFSNEKKQIIIRERLNHLFYLAEEIEKRLIAYVKLNIRSNYYKEVEYTVSINHYGNWVVYYQERSGKGGEHIFDREEFLKACRGYTGPD